MSEEMLFPVDYGRMVFQNLEAILNFLNGFPEKLVTGKNSQKDIYLNLPRVVRIFLVGNEYLMSVSHGEEHCKYGTILSNSISLNDLEPIIDSQEQFARSLLGKLGPEDHFLLDVDGIQTPKGVERKTEIGKGIFVKGTLADFIRWIAENNLEKNPKEG